MICWQASRDYQRPNTSIKLCWSFCSFTIANLTCNFLLWTRRCCYSVISKDSPFQVWVDTLNFGIILALLTHIIVDIYPAVGALQKLVGFTFSFPTAIAGKRRPLHLPEVQMISLIVISTKLLFPFDDINRYPESAREPSTQVIDWQLWAQVQGHFEQRETSSGRIGKGNEVLVNEKDVFSMTSSQLDEYLDWYESSWLDFSKGACKLSEVHLSSVFS